MSFSCDETEGIIFIGKTTHPKKVVKRINALVDEICKLKKSYEAAKSKINVYCPEEVFETADPDPESEPCFEQCEEEPVVDVMYQINNSHITTELLEYLALVEANVCETKILIKELEEEAKINCVEAL